MATRSARSDVGREGVGEGEKKRGRNRMEGMWKDRQDRLPINCYLSCTSLPNPVHPVSFPRADHQRWAG